MTIAFLLVLAFCLFLLLLFYCIVWQKLKAHKAKERWVPDQEVSCLCTFWGAGGMGLCPSLGVSGYVPLPWGGGG